MASQEIKHHGASVCVAVTEVFVRNLFYFEIYKIHAVSTTGNCTVTLAAFFFQEKGCGYIVG